MNKLFEIKQIDRDAVKYLVRNLEDAEKDRAIRGGLAAAGQVFKKGGASRLRQRMKSGSKGVTGNLLRSFVVRVKRFKPGALVGFKQGAGGGSHAHLIDQGTAMRYWDKNGKSVGRVRATSFWSDTRSQDYPKAMDKIWDGLDKAISRINSRR